MFLEVLAQGIDLSRSLRPALHLVVFPRYIPNNQRMANPHSDLFHGTEEPRDLFVNAIRVNSSVVMWAPCFGSRLLLNEVPPCAGGNIS